MSVETTTDHPTLDAIVAGLQAHSAEWVSLALSEKVAMLDRLRPRIMAEADAMVRETQRAKGIDPATVWGAEDWITGPWAFLQGVTALLTTLRRVEKGELPVETSRTRTRAGGQTVVESSRPPRPTPSFCPATAPRSGCCPACPVATRSRAPPRCTGGGATPTPASPSSWEPATSARSRRSTSSTCCTPRGPSVS